MEFLVPLSLLLAGLVGLVGVAVVVRRQLAENARRKNTELEALDRRIASRIEGLREGREATEIAPGPDWLDQPSPAIVPVETSLAARLRRRIGGADEGGRTTVLRDTVAALGVAVVLLFVVTRFLPAAAPPTEGTPSPSPTELSVLPTGTPNLLRPTPIVTATPAETASPTPDITTEPTDEPTPEPTVYFPPPPGSTPAPAPKPTSPPTTCTTFLQILPVGSSTVSAGLSRPFEAYLKNTCGGSTTVTGSTTFSITGSGTCSAASCGSTTAGSYTVTGTYSGKTDTAGLEVTAAAFDHVIISPSSSSITAGGSQAYTAEAFDVYGNSRGAVTASYGISGVGSCTGNSCTSTDAGAHTVTGTYSTDSDTASLTVNPAALDHITLSPQDTSVAAGGSETYTTTGWDQYNNSLGNVTSTSSFSIDSDGSCTNNTCTATTQGTVYTVTASHSGVSSVNTSLTAT